MRRFKSFFWWLVQAKSKNADQARQEHILNILLLGTICLAVAAAVSAFSTYLYALAHQQIYPGIPIQALILAAGLFGGFLLLSKKGHPRLASWLMVLLYFLLASYTAFNWGADVPQALLIFALVVIMTGILLGTRDAFTITFLIAVVLYGLTYAQANQLIVVHSAWKARSVSLPDTYISIITFLLLTIISWLYNREISNSLKKIFLSKKELKEERDSLEDKVEERTHQLKAMQLEKMRELYRFAEFGRIASGLFHDLSTPLTSMTLNLELLEQNLVTKQKTDSLLKSMAKAKLNIVRIEEFVVAARQQIQKQENKEQFLLNQELLYVLQVLEYKARQLHVKLEMSAGTKQITIYGNALKMNQVLTNLVSNAIDAYQGYLSKKKAKVLIHVYTTKKQIKILVQDWGSGIPASIQPLIFEPLFTTKPKELGMGIGLSISQEIVEKDFHGNIHFRSQQGKGSLFIVTLPIYQPAS